MLLVVMISTFVFLANQSIMEMEVEAIPLTVASRAFPSWCLRRSNFETFRGDGFIEKSYGRGVLIPQFCASMHLEPGRSMDV